MVDLHLDYQATILRTHMKLSANLSLALAECALAGEECGATDPLL